MFYSKISQSKHEFLNFNDFSIMLPLNIKLVFYKNSIPEQISKYEELHHNNVLILTYNPKKYKNVTFIIDNEEDSRKFLNKNITSALSIPFFFRNISDLHDTVIIIDSIKNNVKIEKLIDDYGRLSII